MRDELDLAGLLDGEVAAVLAKLPLDLGGLDHGKLQLVRAGMADLPRPELSDRVERRDYDVADTDGVTVRVHRPVDAAGDLPCVYWIHGGGLIFRSNLRDDLRFDRWCAEFNCVGVSVHYRLAPETPYPGPLADCYAGLQWVHENAGVIGVETSRVGIAGASAGGGLAAGLALLARDRGGPPIAFQLLIYPMIDDRRTTVSSSWNDPIWPPDANEFGWTAYLGDAKGGPDVEPYAAPARATDLAGLPPTFITVGAIDGFSDEDIDYAVRLRHAGVPVDLHVFAGAPHGYDSFMPDTTVATRSVVTLEAWLATALA